MENLHDSLLIKRISIYSFFLLIFIDFFCYFIAFKQVIELIDFFKSSHKVSFYDFSLFWNVITLAVIVIANTYLIVIILFGRMISGFENSKGILNDMCLGVIIGAFLFTILMIIFTALGTLSNFFFNHLNFDLNFFKENLISGMVGGFTVGATIGMIIGFFAGLSSEKNPQENHKEITPPTLIEEE
jgi:hypothetical protein